MQSSRRDGLSRRRLESAPDEDSANHPNDDRILRATDLARSKNEELVEVPGCPNGETVDLLAERERLE